MYKEEIIIDQETILVLERDLTHIDDVCIEIALIDKLCSSLVHIGTYTNGTWCFANARNTQVFWTHFNQHAHSVCNSLKKLSNSPKDLKVVFGLDKDRIGLISKICKLF